MPTSILLKSTVNLKAGSACLLAALALAVAPCGAQLPAAQAPPATAASAPARKPIHARKPPAATHFQPATQPSTPAPVLPPVPELPAWPVNEKPAQAAVTWDSRGLRIEAQNSSLQQILQDVATATGAKVEGMGADERIFGAYGPAPARDVISQLLEGSGYNVIMIGEQGQGTPRQIVLSERSPGSTHPSGNANQAANGDEDADVEEPQQPQPQLQPPMPIRPGFAPGTPPRTPQQIMQQMQQRQQEMQVRPQVQPPDNPPN